MRYIWVVRHAKSSRAQAGQRDFERPLNDRGRADAARVATLMPSLAEPAASLPTWLWCSSAVRAQQTAEHVRAGFGIPANHCVTLEELYQASPRTLLDVLQRTPETESSVAIVAHNPGLTDLCNALEGAQVTDNLPTLGMALFAFGPSEPAAPPMAFHDLRPGGAQLLALYSPRALNRQSS